jgi:hypothetical protein
MWHWNKRNKTVFNWSFYTTPAGLWGLQCQLPDLRAPAASTATQSIFKRSVSRNENIKHGKECAPDIKCCLYFEFWTNFWANLCPHLWPQICRKCVLRVHTSLWPKIWPHICSKDVTRDHTSRCSYFIFWTNIWPNLWPHFILHGAKNFKFYLEISRHILHFLEF